MATHVTEKTHAELGPSKWDQWGNCAGSIPLGADLPNVSSRYAREGTAAHELHANCLDGELDAEDLLGKEYEVEGEIFVVDRDMTDAVDAALNYVRDTVQPERGDILLVEQGVPLQQLTGEQDAEGTSDVIAIVDGGKTMVVMDYKHGQGVKVYASEKDGSPNGQMAMYALGALSKYGLIYDEVEQVRLVILQTRLEHIDEHELTVEELEAFGEKVTEAAGRVEINRQRFHESGGDVGVLDLNPTDKGCKFCKAKVRCPALKALTSNALSIASNAEDFDDLTLPKQASSVVVGAELPAEKLAEVMRAIPLVEDYMKAIRAEVERRLLAAEPVPGYYLGIGKAGNRKWADEEVALKEMTKSGRLKMAEATVAKPISPTQAEKLLKARPKIWSQIAPLITQSEGGPSVCRDGDANKPYILPSSTPEDFDDLDAPEVDAAALLLDDGEELLVDKMQRIANGAAAVEGHGLLDD